MKIQVVPQHVAIIMDGNGRWAKRRGLARQAGHKMGAQTLMNIVRHAHTRSVSFLTVYAFSTENWCRPADEVQYLMNLPFEFLDQFEDKFKGDDIIVKFIGSRDKLEQRLIDKMDEIEEKSKNNKGMVFIIALNYGGRDEIMHALKAMNASQSIIDQTQFNNYLYTKDIPDVDLMIRTSGEYRISNFLLWQSAYSELYFTKTLWPDFTPRHFDKALKVYAKRNRRFGGLV